MGARKFLSKYCKEQSLDFAQLVVDTYRKEWAPCVPKLWYALEGAAVQTVHSGKPHSAFGIVYELCDGWLTVRLPSGRRIWYYGPQPTFRAMPWDDADIRPGFTYKTWKTGQWITRDAFGGLLTENVVMGIERDIMVHGMFLAEKNGFPIVLTVHDELVAEPMKADADEKALQQIMTDMPDWVKAIQVPIAVDTWQGDRYRK
jgi:DNA polymerase